MVLILQDVSVALCSSGGVIMRIFYRLSIVILIMFVVPGQLWAIPVISVKSSKVILNAEVSGELLGGGVWSESTTTQTNMFTSASASYAGGDVYVDENADQVIDGDDEVVRFDVYGDFTTSGLCSSYLTNAETYYPGDYPEPATNPLPEVTSESLKVKARIVAKSIFKIEGGESVEFSADVYNWEGSYNDSFGRFELWDLTDNQMLIELDDRYSSGYYASDTALLQSEHTYKLFVYNNNQTGGDEEIEVFYWFDNGTVTVDGPRQSVLFSLGLVGLCMIMVLRGAGVVKRHEWRAY